MDIDRAKEIISALAEGIDPTTGEILPDDSVCNKGDVVRAFYAIIETIDKKSKRNMPENAGKAWTMEEEQLLIKMYNSGVSKKEMCDAFKRTEVALAARLVHLGIIESRDVFRGRK